MSEQVTITIKLKPETTAAVLAIIVEQNVAATRRDAFESAGDANGAAVEHREVERLQALIGVYAEQAEHDARKYAHAQDITISPMPAWRVQFCREAKVAMVEFFEGKGY